MARTGMQNYEEGEDAQILKNWNSSPKRIYCLILIIIILLGSSGAIGILNILGQSSLKTEVVDIPKTCSQSSTCEIDITLQGYTAPVRIYYEYENFFASHFVFAKNQELGDLYNTAKVFSRLDDCYPVETVADFKKTLSAYGISNIPEKINSSDDSSTVFPCGVKALLYSSLDKIEIKDVSTPLDIKIDNLVPKKYLEFIKDKDSDWTNGEYKTAKYFSWLIPQIPISGTYYYVGHIDKDLSGTYKGIITLNFPNYDQKINRKLYIISGQKTFTSLSLGIISLLSCGLTLIVTIIYAIIKVIR